MKDVYPFLSAPWFGAVEEEAQRIIGALPDKEHISFSYTEVFTDLPSDKFDEAALGYTMTVKGGVVSLSTDIGPNHPVDMIVHVDYAAGLPNMRLKSTDPDFQERMAATFASGKVRLVCGSLDALPVDLSALHDAVCDRTLLD